MANIQSKDMSDFAALKCGVATFVGSFGEPPESDTADAMILFYENFLADDSVDKSLLSKKRIRIPNTQRDKNRSLNSSS